MMNTGNLKGKTRQMSDWRRRLIALVAAFTLLISSCGLTAFAETDDDIYSAPVTAPIAPATTSPAPEEGDVTETPAPEGEPETSAEPEEAPGEDNGEVTGEETGEETGEQPETEGEPEAADETAQEDVTVYEPGTLTAEADGATFTVDYTAEARVPEGTVLTIARAAGSELYSAMKSAARVLKDEANETWKREMGDEAVFYTIALTDAAGYPLHPATGMTLKCENLIIPANATGFVTGIEAENLDWKGTLTLDFLPETIGYAYLKKTQIGTVTLTHEARDYMVIAAYGPEAAFPVGTELKVKEIMPGTPEYALYSGMTDEALNEDWSEITLERYFDIAFVSNGEELEPQGDVDVQIIFRDKIEQNEETEVQAVHIENNEATVIEAETESNKSAKHDDEAIDTVTFTSDSFSVYGVVQKKKIITKVLAADGLTYEIEVTYTQEAGIPEDAQVKVEEIPEGSDLWEAYRKQTAAALNADDVRLPGLYDISIIDAEGNSVEPKVPVSVSIRLANAEGSEDLHVVHFTEDIPDELVAAAKEEQTEVQLLAQEDQINSEKISVNVEGDTVTFKTDGFSVYAFAYAVNFEYLDASFEMLGNSEILLSDLLSNLATGADISSVTSVSYTGTAMELTETENHDWLIKITPKAEEQSVLTVRIGDTVIDIDVAATGKESVELDDAVISAADGVYLPNEATGQITYVEENEEIVALIEQNDKESSEQEATEPKTTEQADQPTEPAEEGTPSQATVSETYYQVYDINLNHVDEENYESGFQVEMKLNEAVEGENVRLWHVHDGEVTEIKDFDLKNDTLSFVTENFSYFVLSYAVSFEYKGASSELLGNSEILLSKLLGDLATGVDISSVTEVSYTGTAVELQDAENNDKLIKIVPNAEEQSVLIVRTADAVVEITVTATGKESIELDDAVISAADGVYLPNEATGQITYVEENEEIIALIEQNNKESAEQEATEPKADEQADQPTEPAEEATPSQATVSETYYQVYDINLNHVDEENYESGFQVEMKLNEAVEGENVRLWHVHDGQVTEIKEFDLKSDTLSFVTENFSYFVLSYAVSFEYKGASSELLGNSEILLSKLLSDLATGVDISNVTEVSYTGTAVELQDAENSDKLLKIVPNAEEQSVLTVRTADAVIEITVTATGKESVELDDGVISAADGVYLPNEATGQITYVEENEEIIALIEQSNTETAEQEDTTEATEEQTETTEEPETTEQKEAAEQNNEMDASVDNADVKTKTITETHYLVYDISLDNVNEEDYESGFQIEMKLNEAVNGDNVCLWHVHEGQVTEIKEFDLKDDTLSFVTENFSYFVLSYAVSFEYKGASSELLGNSEILLSKLLSDLATGVDISNITEISYTGTVVELQDAENNDKLIKIVPNAEEQSVLTFRTADAVVEITVTATGKESVELDDGVISAADGVYLPNEATGQIIYVEENEEIITLIEQNNKEAAEQEDTTETTEEKTETTEQTEATEEQTETTEQTEATEEQIETTEQIEKTEEPGTMEQAATTEETEETGQTSIAEETRAAEQTATAEATEQIEAPEQTDENKAPADNENVKTKTITETRYQIYDISLENVDEENYESGFQVEMKLNAVVQGDNVRLWHVHDDLVDEIKEFDLKDNTLSFTTDNFSYFVISYTVDFVYVDENGETYAWSFPGRGRYPLTDILDQINKSSDVVSDAILKLIEGEDHEGALYLTTEDNNWYLNSDIPFEDTYLLTIKTDSDEYVLRVTDATYKKQYSIMLKINPAGLTITDDDQIYYFASGSINNETLYAYGRIVVNSNDSIVMIPVNWLDQNGHTKADVNFTGNETVILGLYTNNKDKHGVKPGFGDMNNIRYSQEKVTIKNGDSINRYNVNYEQGYVVENDDVNHITYICNAIDLTAPTGDISKGYIDQIIDDATDFGYYTEVFESSTSNDIEATIGAASLKAHFGADFGYSSSNVNVNRLKVLKVFTNADGSPVVGKNVTIRLTKDNKIEKEGSKNTDSEGKMELEFDGLSSGIYKISEMIDGVEYSESFSGTTMSVNFSRTNVAFADNTNMNYFGTINYDVNPIAERANMLNKATRVPAVILTNSEEEVNRLIAIRDDKVNNYYSKSTALTIVQNGTSGYKNYDIVRDMVNLRNLSDTLASAQSSNSIRVINLTASEMSQNGLRLDDDGRFIVLNIKMDRNKFCPLVILDGNDLPADYGQSGKQASSRVLYNLRSNDGGLYIGDVNTNKNGAGVILAPSANMCDLEGTFGGTIIAKTVNRSGNEMHSNNSKLIQTRNVTIQNVIGTPTTGSLELNKQFSNPDIKDKITYFTFEVSLTNSSDPSKVQNKTFPASGLKTGSSVTFDSVGKALVQVCADNSVTITDLPDGTTYSIYETDPQFYYFDYILGATGIIEAGKTKQATVYNTNTYNESGSLKIKKVLKLSDNAELDMMPVFSFRVSDETNYYYLDGEGKLATVAKATATDTDGIISVTAGKSSEEATGVTLSGLQPGTYKVEEVNEETVNGYAYISTSMSDGTNTEAGRSINVTVIADDDSDDDVETVIVTAENSYDRELGSLKIKKVLKLSDNAELDTMPVFSFRVSDETNYYYLNGEGKLATVAKATATDTDGIISVTAGKSSEEATGVTLSGLQPGTYKVEEVNEETVNGYAYTSTTMSDGTNTETGRSINVTVIADDDSDDDVETVIVTAENNYTKGKIKVIKRYSGVNTLPDTFVITANWVGLDEPLQLRIAEEQPENVTLDGPIEEGGEIVYTWTIDNLPIGTIVTFTESEDGCQVPGYSWSSKASVNGGTAINGGVSGEAEVVADTANYVTITNTYIAGVALPSTGGSGTLIYTIAGMALIVLAGVILVNRKRKFNR